LPSATFCYSGGLVVVVVADQLAAGGGAREIMSVVHDCVRCTAAATAAAG